jgi:hypothetical protein
MSDTQLTTATLTLPNPHRGPDGQPFAVRAIGDAGELVEHYDTEATAWDRRDQLLDAGYRQVRVVGAPTQVWAVFPPPDPSMRELEVNTHDREC